MSADESVQLDITLLGRPYRFACKASEQHELLDAVGYLDRKMREIKDAGKVTGAERLAVMAALNIAHELLRARAGAPSGTMGADVQRRISTMRQAIDKAMAEQERLF
jgi:cell division protein ZapA